MDKLTDIMKGYSKDLEHIKLLISEYLNEHHDIKRLITNINDGDFKFDKVLYEQLRSIDDHRTIVAKLKLLSKKIIIERSIKDVDFPNVLISCVDANDPVSYCSNRKLIVPPGRLNEILDILASDIKNPIKENILFSMAYINNIRSL